MLYEAKLRSYDAFLKNIAPSPSCFLASHHNNIAPSLSLYGHLLAYDYHIIRSHIFIVWYSAVCSNISYKSISIPTNKTIHTIELRQKSICVHPDELLNGDNSLCTTLHYTAHTQFKQNNINFCVVFIPFQLNRLSYAL